MTTVVLGGPSLHGVTLPAGIRHRPPAAQGDVLRAVRDGARIVGLIDGGFEGVPAVLHQEILWAMAEGVQVLGAASMGALRAAELHRFGMVGVGAIFEAYRYGRLRDDAEVALLHAPAELSWAPLTEPLVDVRATLEAAGMAGALDRAEAGFCLEVAARLHYKERTWPAILASLPGPLADLLRPWLADGRVRAKQADALALIACLGGSDPMPAPQPTWRFIWTDAFDRLAGQIASEASTDRLDDR